MKKVKEYALITFGIVLVAIGVEYFFAPNNLAAGGVTGFAVVLNNYIPLLNIGSITFILNGILFFIAFIVFGRGFGGKTLFASLGLSLVMWIIESFLAPAAITEDLIIASIFGTIISSLGMAIVFNNNCSTGGTDILAKILNKFMHLNIGASLLVVDFLITLGAAVTFGLDIGFYSMLCVLMNGLMIDKFIDGFNSCKEVIIISHKSEEISEYILNYLSRGCTFLKGEGAYTNKEIKIIYAVLSRSDYIKLKNYLKEVDKTAFITVRGANEVLGEGFKDIDEM